ncbi:dol-P-Glc:Glc(2)Man(9)GlcNAc(2)-PP-Dol alpha-1,2-glucosyltransferase-like [Apostichopus japonicus]|uniref:dol-P-Glc:Glc(2)Man(9)GlcNAc(2)-PP-Dol alpha-1,2-glucosyltransferase-like n=1 Tax=Stichopus japonicus TaxID=307972 RepID=UPI003AB7A1B8
MTYNCSSAQLSIPSWYPGESAYGTKIDEKINCLLESKMDVTISAGRFAVSALFVLVTAVIFLQVEKFQHTPYMDEIFHVPQAQKYCAGNFTEWDPMITTPPGLYVMSVALIQPVSQLLQVEREDICTTHVLRMTNIFFAVMNFFVLDALYRRIHRDNRVSDGMLPSATAFNISIFPVLYFFSNLYYTDMGSTSFVLLAYLSSQYSNHFLAAIFGILSLLFRQTNIVWVVFLAGITFARLFERDAVKSQNQTKQMSKSYLSAVQAALNYALSVKNLRKIVTHLWLYALVVACFLAFVFINKGIVLGDKEHHQAVFNVPQLFYFFALTAGFAAPVLVSVEKVNRFLKTVKSNFGSWVIVMLMMVGAVHQFTYVHKYLLADNRHIPFYVWRKIYQQHWLVKYILVPGYAYAGWSMSDSLSVKSLLWKLTYVVCLIVACVPQKLLEFRYFILPFIVFRLNIPPLSRWQLLVEFVLFSAINGAMLYLFMMRPFKWEGHPGLQRFIW